MKPLRDESGQTLVLSALLMCILMGFMALAIDVGVLFRAQRKVQTEADAAVTAGALCAVYGNAFCTQYSGTDWKSVAKGAATFNGMSSSATFTPSGSGGPTYGQHTGTGYVEVIITEPSPTVFMSTFFALSPWLLNSGSGSPNYLSATVGARAVAGLVPGQTCLIALNPSSPDAIDVKGGAGGSKGAGASISAPACSIQINSSNADALCATGNGSIDSQQILIVGQQNGSGHKCNAAQNNVQTGATAAPNPFANIVPPQSGCVPIGSPGANTYGWGGGVTDTLSESGGVITLTNNSTGAKQTVNENALLPFTPVTGGASVSGQACFEDAVNLTSSLGSSTNNNLMWVFQNGLNIAGSGHVIIQGTVDISAGQFQEANSDLFISGPTGQATSQPYTGMAFIDTATVNGCPSSINSIGTIPSGDGCIDLQFGSGGSPTFSCSSNSIATGQCNCSNTSTQPGIIGTIYAPKNVLFFQDSGSCVSATNIISDEIWDNGAITIYNFNLAFNTSPLNVVRLVE